MKKIIFTVVSIVFSIVLLLQVQSVLAHHGDEDKPISSPISSPVTSPIQCKPGWGFGDKNHCHEHGVIPGHDKDDHHDNGKHNGDDHNNKPFLSPLGHK